MAPSWEHIVETKRIWNKTVKLDHMNILRAEGSVPSPKSFPNPSIGKGSEDLDRQFHSADSHLESGRDPLPTKVPVALGATDLVTPEEDSLESTIYHRGKGCDSRSIIPHTSIQTTGWSLNPRVFKNLCNHWGTLNIDLFSTQLNHKLPVYVSPFSDLPAWVVEALSIP